MKCNNCVVFGITSNLVFAVANVMIAIEKYSKGLVDKYIILYDPEDPISEYEQNVIYKITENIEFRIYKLNSDIKLSQELLDRYSKAYLFKFEIFNLLNECQKVLWLDADILIQGDISKIFTYNYIAWRKTVKPFCENCSEWNGKSINEFYTAPNGGVILVTDALCNYDQLYTDSFQILEELYKIYNRGFIDELTFGILGFKYGLNVNLMEPKYNSVISWKESKEAVLIHSIGKKKFWNDIYYYLDFPKWGEFNDIYIDYGGKTSPVKGISVDIFRSKNELLYKMSLNYRYWYKLLNGKKISNKIIQSQNLFRGYVQFYIDDIYRDIHYELLKSGGDKVIVALHFEGNFKSEKNTLVMKSYKLIADRLGFMMKKNNKVLSIERVVSEKECIEVLNKLVVVTINLLLLKYKKGRTYSDMVVCTMKHIYHLLKGC